MHDLRISLTDRCNLRCSYCMPAEIFGPDFKFLPRKELLTYEEIHRAATLFAQLGVKKLRLTGGEPLMRKDVDQLIKMLKSIPEIEEIAMTSNGVMLPLLAERLKGAGLDRITVSLDALDDSVFKSINGQKTDVATVLKGIEVAQGVDLPIKVNMVVQKGVNDSQILPMARHFREMGIPLRFIEYMDVGNQNGWKLDQVITAKSIIEIISKELPLEPVDPKYRGEVAKRYRYRDGGVELGVISSVTQPFCGDCNRARLSANGQLFTCLFASGGHDFKTVLREHKNDSDVLEFIRKIWGKRADRYSEKRTELTRKNKVEMNFIGG